MDNERSGVQQHVIAPNGICRILRRMRSGSVESPATEVYDLLKNSGLFYHSTTFQLLQEGIADLHCRSDIYLADELMMEYP